MGVIGGATAISGVSKGDMGLMKTASGPTNTARQYNGVNTITAVESQTKWDRCYPSHTDGIATNLPQPKAAYSCESPDEISLGMDVLDLHSHFLTFQNNNDLSLPLTPESTGIKSPVDQDSFHTVLELLKNECSGALESLLSSAAPLLESSACNTQIHISEAMHAFETKMKSKVFIHMLHFKTRDFLLTSF